MAEPPSGVPCTTRDTKRDVGGNERGAKKTAARCQRMNPLNINRTANGGPTCPVRLRTGGGAWDVGSGGGFGRFLLITCSWRGPCHP